MADYQHGQVVLGGEGMEPLPSGPEPSFPEPQPHRPQMQIPNIPEDGIPRFFLKAVRLANGQYENREYVQVIVPGDNKNLPEHKVTDMLREKYRPWYEQWRSGLTDRPSGTPLEMWPLLSPAEVETLKVNNIFTVEQLIGMADANDHRIPMIRTLKRKARDWLASKQEADAIEKNSAEREAMKTAMDRQEETIDALAAKVEELTAALEQQRGSQEAPEPPKTGKRGRPRKTA